MKAVICTKFGSVDHLQVREMDKPIPREDEILVKIHATTVTAGDVMVRKLTFPMSVLVGIMARVFMGQKNLRKKVLGHEFAGEVEATGSQVTSFQVGDQVFGTTSGLASGAHAEYICVPAEGIIALKPDNVDYMDAAAVPVGGMTALFLLKQGDLSEGQQVLVYGASGSVGTYAVQIARAYGAEVTGVCSTRNIELVRSLGVATVIDYTMEDFTESEQRFDLIFDAVGKTSASAVKPILKEGGRFVTVRSITKEKKENLLNLGELMKSGKIQPVIDRNYSLRQIPDAHRYVETGRKKGNVVITI